MFILQARLVIFMQAMVVTWAILVAGQVLVNFMRVIWGHSTVLHARLGTILQARLITIL